MSKDLKKKGQATWIFCKSDPSPDHDQGKGPQAGVCLCAPEAARMAVWSGGQVWAGRGGGR